MVGQDLEMNQMRPTREEGKTIGQGGREGFQKEAVSLRMRRLLSVRAGGREGCSTGNACRGWESGKIRRGWGPSLIKWLGEELVQEISGRRVTFTECLP